MSFVASSWLKIAFGSGEREGTGKKDKEREQARKIRRGNREERYRE